jgi:hypothetical protein
MVCEECGLDKENTSTVLYGTILVGVLCSACTEKVLIELDSLIDLRGGSRRVAEPLASDSATVRRALEAGGC